MLDDLHLAFRSFRSGPGFAAIVVTTLGVGIAGATLVFSIVNAAVFRLYDSYPSPDRLALLLEQNQRAGRSALASAPDVAEWKRVSKSFDFVGGMEVSRVTAAWGAEPRSLVSVAVSRDVLPMLGAKSEAGRLFLEEDFNQGAPPLVLLSHRSWQEHFGEDRSVVGRTLIVNGKPCAVGGVLTPAFRLLPFFGAEPDVLTVLALDGSGDRARRSVFAIGTLRAEVSADQAGRELGSVLQAAAEHDPAARGWTVNVRKARGLDLKGEAAFVVVLAAGVGFLLLIVCANVTNLVLGRTMARTKELATRLALGATRMRLVRQLLAESLLLGIAGSAAGLFLAYWSCRALSWWLSGTMFSLLDISIDRRAAAFAISVSAACGVLAGLMPSWRSAGADLLSNLKEGRSAVGRLSPGRVRNLLVAAEVGLAVVLLVGSGLVLRGLVNLRHNDPGFSPEGVSSLAVTLSDDRYSGVLSRAAYAQEALSRLERLPRAEVAATSFLPMTGAELPPQPFTVTGRAADPDVVPSAGVVSVTPRFFSTMRIPLKAGRGFDARDGAGALPVALVDERLVEKWMDGRQPIGAVITVGGEARTVVGVVGSVRHFHLNVDPAPAIYVPFAQRPTQGMAFVVRAAATDEAAAVRDARAMLVGVDSTQVVRGGDRMTDAIAASLGGFNMTSMVVAILAAVALGLSAVGIYSVVAYSVARRRREIGIRTALGATPGRLVREILLGAGRMGLVGVVPGVLLSLAVGKLLAARLHRVSALDPLVLGFALTVVLVTVLGASYLPARRASRVDPVSAIRCE